MKRANKTWWMTKKRLRGAKISKRLQAKIVEACVESTLLFDCGSSAVSLGKPNCFFGSTQLYHCDWGGFVPAMLVMLQPVQT